MIMMSKATTAVCLLADQSVRKGGSSQDKMMKGNVNMHRVTQVLDICFRTVSGTVFSEL